MPETERLVLRALREEDVDPLFAIQGDRGHMRFTWCAPSRDACATWLWAYERSRAQHGFAPWTAVLRAEDRVVGWGGLNVDPAEPGWGPEVTYFVHPAYAGRGLATELVAASLAHAFGDLGLPAVAAFARSENHASARVLAKCGFRLVRFEPALERNHYVRNP